MFRSIQKVLIIDDEADIAQMVSDRLTAAGYAVLTADTGASGLEKAFKEKPSQHIHAFIKNLRYSFIV